MATVTSTSLLHVLERNMYLKEYPGTLLTFVCVNSDGVLASLSSRLHLDSSTELILDNITKHNGMLTTVSWYPGTYLVTCITKLSPITALPIRRISSFLMIFIAFLSKDTHAV